jgi:GAF domain-containing protein
MSGDRLEHIRRRLAPEDGGPVGTSRLCDVCAEITEMTGAGIMLMDGDLPQGTVCTTNPVSALIEELQYTLGEGPCVDAYLQQRPVAEPDLADPAQARWLAFTAPAVEAGARAVFGFPLRVGGTRLGALNLYRDRPGALTDDQYADALMMAAVAAQAVIDMQGDAAPGALGAELEIGTNFQFVVHQASGMVAVQLGVNVTEALIRLRAHAFGQDRLVADVAKDVVGGRLRFDRSTE